jgi:hypothetical protein
MITLFPSTSSPLLANAPRQIGLRSGTVHTADLPAGSIITLLAGTLWLTQEYDATDHLVASPEAFTTTHTGRIVMQAIRGPAVVSVLVNRA